ncbi:hypothetical protein QTN47_13105 [Danxiaibacter flavus]|uniref:Polysaccharide biosynthesis protein n=1 Tax=Danxiaibacter flavus TaxID=3049108 RepID=A0ABV3ZFT2_9BACT|nr:hypothetical protein QNM32_13110 [Chitinophagaceae bacterium DXS]
MSKPVRYTKNYFNIYLWKGTGYFASFASLAIATPRLAANPSLFGIFTFCISLNIFFQYADLGFINAAQKYSSEYFARNDIESEIKVTGFSSFILLAFIVPLFLSLLWLSYNPNMIIRDLALNTAEWALAHKLLFTLAIFSPVLIIQRILQIIFSVRLEDHYTQRVNICVSILRVISVFYFFANGKYLIEEYFLFYNLLSLVSIFVIIKIAIRRYAYDFLKLLNNIRFSSEMYQKTSKLAINSLFLALAWIVFYELDLVYIGFFLGKESVAYYALGFTILSFFRDLFGTFYYPFLVRFNHLVGEKNEQGLMSLYHTLLKIGLSIVILPVVCLQIFAEPIIVSWVGFKYEPSIKVVQLLLCSYFLSYITYPASAMLTAKEELKKLYITAAVLPVFFLTGVLLTQHKWGIVAYALFKTLAILVNGTLLFFISLKQLEISARVFFSKYIKPFLLALFSIVLVGNVIVKVLPLEKGFYALFVTVAAYVCVLFFGFFVYFLSDPIIKEFGVATYYRLTKSTKI